MSYLPIVAGKLGVRETFFGDSAHSENKPLNVSHLAVVKPERVFVEVPEQVEGFVRNIRAVQPALEQAPKALNAVSVNFAIDVLYRMIDDTTAEIIIQPVVRKQEVRVDVRSGYTISRTKT